jgi:hypothetical protein
MFHRTGSVNRWDLGNIRVSSYESRWIQRPAFPKSVKRVSGITW